MIAENAVTDAEIRRLGFEPTPKGWVPLDAAEEHRETGLTPRQWRRFSFVTARGWAALPESGLRAFAVAACLGKMMNKVGTFDRIRNVGDALCVVVRPGVRDRVCRLIHASDAEHRMWRRHVAGWIKAGMAHRCPNQPRGTVTLFLEPQQVCPACARPDISVPDDRTSQYRKPDISVPEPVPMAGDASRDGKGDAVLALGSSGSSGSSRTWRDLESSVMAWERDERVQLLEPLYLKAEKQTATYMRRGYWRAAERWADLAAVIYAAMQEVGWQPDEDRQDA